MRIRHENRVNFLFPIFFIVITSSHIACSQVFSTSRSSILPPVINNVASYKNSTSSDSSKRLILLQPFISQLVIDLKYATKNNFTGRVLYTEATAYARLPVAILLKKINEQLNKAGLGLKVYDAYRPYQVTKKMWKVVHDERYTANPTKGSGHNRGAAVDVTLVKISTGEELAMPTAFDDFSEKAHHGYNNLSKEVLDNRALLKTTMEKFGFVSLSTEWWHYSLPNAADRFELLDLSFNQLKHLN
ncbi:M15 family metallopeptidase [Segetibacter aerophilus]|uniref:M15 family metallopeptidase n=1 Tax=Segetibacter aerophilus TaxID=670293 RepID=UPI0011BF676F|nr:M15 family metallopeptidase [Segetibacter aerophilus]